MRMRGRPQDALTVLEHGEKIFDPNARVGQPGYFSQMEMFRLKLMKETCLSALRRHKEAQQAAAEAIEASKPLELPQQAEAQLMASHAALDAGDYTTALRFAEKAESLWKDELKRAGFTTAHRHVVERALVEVYREQGIIYESLNQFDKAEKYFRQAANENRRLGEPESLMSVLCELAEVLRRQERDKEALGVMKEWAVLQAGMRSSLSVSSDELAYGFGQLGQLQLRAGDYSPAEQSLRRAVEFAKDSSRSLGPKVLWRLPELDYELAIALYDQGKIAEADAVAQEEERSWLTAGLDKDQTELKSRAHRKERQLHRQAALERARNSSR
jgi:tetratricopeptide (TPR) repeat protein